MLCEAHLLLKVRAGVETVALFVRCVATYLLIAFTDLRLEAFALARRLGEILAHRERRHVAMTSAIEITRRRMVQRVVAPPLGKRRQREHAGDESHRVGQRAGREERPVGAVVHDDERAHQQPGGDRGEQQREQH